jgi:hypothetical protein
MTDISIKIREHYAATGLIGRIREALTTIAPENQALTVAELAPLDQFHTRGILATTELARAAGLDPSTACWTLAAASAARRAILPGPSAVR